MVWEPFSLCTPPSPTLKLTEVSSPKTPLEAPLWDTVWKALVQMLSQGRAGTQLLQLQGFPADLWLRVRD